MSSATGRVLFALLVVCLALSVDVGTNRGTAIAVTPAVNLVALGTVGQTVLVQFSSATPGTTNSRAIANIDASETLRAIDFRPTTSILYGLAVNPSQSYVRLYTISLPSFGGPYNARPFVATVPVPSASGSWGMSFDPVRDDVRVVSTSNMNLRLNPNTGSLAAIDADLNPSDPSVDSAAYSDPAQGASATVLYGIDVATSRLVTIDPADSGTLHSVGPLGVSGVVSSGLDFSSTGVLYAAIRIGNLTSLYTVNPTTGAATLVGPIGSSGFSFIDSLAVRDVPAVHMDFDADARADFVVTRLGPNGTADWFFLRSSDNGVRATNWGLFGDVFLPADFDGDGLVDVNVWRPGPSAMFFRRHSADSASVITQWGTTGDDPTVVRDYDRDGRADIAVYRVGTAPGAQSVWYSDGSSSGPLAMPFGANDGAGGDTAAPGDYDADGRADHVVRRNAGGAGMFYLQQTRAGFAAIPWGLSTDTIVPGDWDGDGKDDLAVVRNEKGVLVWYVRPSASPATLAALVWGLAGDFLVPADYEADGKTDCAVWRPSSARFYIRRSLDGTLVEIPWGLNTDFPVAASFVH
jgi:hypothetical protein